MNNFIITLAMLTSIAFGFDLSYYKELNKGTQWDAELICSFKRRSNDLICSVDRIAETEFPTRQVSNNFRFEFWDQTWCMRAIKASPMVLPEAYRKAARKERDINEFVDFDMKVKCIKEPGSNTALLCEEWREWEEEEEDYMNFDFTKDSS
ncbi:hypothetical protein NHQ30_011167 [Ciborinia camelliae]|nr:hypothetical protein NHQ30_011167 [Ciborinia camelliae]